MKAGKSVGIGKGEVKSNEREREIERDLKKEKAVKGERSREGETHKREMANSHTEW